jgi:hypothetical protein
VMYASCLVEDKISRSRLSAPRFTHSKESTRRDSAWRCICFGVIPLASSQRFYPAPFTMS